MLVARERHFPRSRVGGGDFGGVGGVVEEFISHQSGENDDGDGGFELGEFGSQHASAATEARGGGAGWAADAGGGFLDGEAFEMMEDENLAIDIGEAAEGAVDFDADFLAMGIGGRLQEVRGGL